MTINTTQNTKLIEGNYQNYSFNNINLLFDSDKKYDFYECENNIVFIAGFPIKRELNEFNYNIRKRAESISNLYSNIKSKFIDFIKDIFCVIIFDKISKQIFIYTDHFGIYKVFYKKEERFIFTDSISLFKSIGNNKISKDAIADILIGNYILENNSVLQDVYTLTAGSFVIIDEEKHFSIKRYFSWEDILANSKNDKSIDYKILLDSFEKVVLEMMDGFKDVGITLTGGFDSRTILSLLINKGIKPKGFTFGLKNSSDAFYAKKLSEKLNLDHKILSPDNNFYKNFKENSYKVFKDSNGFGSVFRTYRVTVFNNLEEEPDVVFFGYGGSEFIRGLWPDGLLISNHIENLLKGKLLPNIEQLSEKIIDESFFRKDILYDILMNRLSRLSNNCYFNQKHYDERERSFLFLVNEIIPKHFGTYYSMYSKYFVTRSPFLDIDFLLLLLKSRYSILNKTSLNDSPFLRFRGPELYAKMISSLSKKIAFIKTGKGYIPYLAMNILLLPFAIPGYLFEKFITNNLNAFPLNFSYENWFRRYLSVEIEDNKRYDLINYSKLNSLPNTGNDEYSNLNYAKILNLIMAEKMFL